MAEMDMAETDRAETETAEASAAEPDDAPPPAASETPMPARSLPPITGRATFPEKRSTVFHAGAAANASLDGPSRSEEHTSELQSLMRISYAVFCLKKKKNNHIN